MFGHDFKRLAVECVSGPEHETPGIAHCGAIARSVDNGPPHGNGFPQSDTNVGLPRARSVARERPTRRDRAVARSLQRRLRVSGRPLSALLCALLLCSGACASRRAARQASGAEDRLRRIRIEGNEALDDDTIKEHLYLEETEWFPLPRRAYLYESYLEVDRERIEALYHAHGYYGATVTDVRVERVRERPVVDVVFVVDEGAPTTVRSIDLRWPEGPPSGPPDERATPASVESHQELTVGRAFDVGELHDSEATMASALHSRGYAFASVTGKARVDRVERTADVSYTLVPGPFVRLGRVEIEGLVTVPEHPVRVEVEGLVGMPFSPARLQRMEDAVYALDVFGTVSVTHAEQPPNGMADGVVDVKIVVEEDRPQALELGVSLRLQPTRWEQLGTIRYTHDNLGRTLTQLSARLEAGYAELPSALRPQEHGPIVTLSPRLRKKGLLEDRLVWTLEPKLELGIWPGYQFYAASNRVGVSRFFTRFLEVGLAHDVRFVDFFHVSPTLDASRSVLGLDYRDPYLLSGIETRVAVYLTDRMAAPRNGVVLEVTHYLAGGIFGGQFDFNKVIPELRGYYTPLPNRLQLAARAQLGFIVPFGDEPGAPFDLKLYLGGADTVRGWGPRQLSPTVSRCSSGSCQRIPVGGRTSVLGNAELRVRVWQELWTVAFFDLGDVQEDVATFRPSHWTYAMGPGLRYHSPIGSFRLDLGIRLNDPWQYPNDRRWALHLGLGGTF